MQQLLDGVWGQTAEIDERTVDVHIRRLRLALEPYGQDALVETVRGSGYRLTPQRELILRAVQRLGHATPDEVLTEVRRESAAVNLSTVYRTLALYADHGIKIGEIITRQITKEYYDRYFDKRVEVAGAGAHHQALHGCETHRGVDRPATEDRRGRRTVTEVQHDLAERRQRPVEIRRGLLADVLVDAGREPHRLGECRRVRRGQHADAEQSLGLPPRQPPRQRAAPEQHGQDDADQRGAEVERLRLTATQDPERAGQAAARCSDWLIHSTSTPSRSSPEARAWPSAGASRRSSRRRPGIRSTRPTTRR